MIKWLLHHTWILLFLLALFGLADVCIGEINIFHDKDITDVVLQLRLPKTLTAVAAGGTIAICGLLLQILFRNPLAGPYVLGISSSASLFVSIGILSGITSNIIFLNHLSLTGFAIVGAWLGILIIFLILKITQQIGMVLLIGFMLAQFYSAFQSILDYWSDAHALKMLVVWNMASIQNTSLYQSVTLLILSIIAFGLALFFTKPLTAYLMGDEDARLLGIDIHKTRNILIFIVSILTGITTAYCGPIALIGMCIPILVRISSHQANITLWIKNTFLFGALSLLLTDVINSMFFAGSVPVNILISLWGIPLIVWVLVKQTKIFI